MNFRQQTRMSMKAGSALEGIPKTVNKHTKRKHVEREDTV